MSPTWETAADWDGAQSASGVAHESVTNTDHGDASTVVHDYSFSSPPPVASANLVAWYPCHESSGTIHDVINANDATSTTVTSYDVAGPLYGSAVSLDGSDDSIVLPSLGFTDNDPLSMLVLVKYDSTGSHRAFNSGNAAALTHQQWGSNGFEWKMNDGSGTNQVITSGISTTGSWLVLLGTFDGSIMEFYVDGVSQGSKDIGGSTMVDDFEIGGKDGFNNFPGDVAHAAVWNTALSDPQAQTLSDVLHTSGSLTTGVKTA